jgi:hypothetical protein
MNEETMIFFGEAVKALDDKGKVGGLLVRFRQGGEVDVTGEHFTSKSYLGANDGDGVDVLFHHGIPVSRDLKAFADHIFSNPVKTKRTDVGIWAETVLSQADEYEAEVLKLVKAGKLGWSSGSTMRVVRKSADGEILRWPIIEASLTHKPAEPLNRAIAIKSVETFGELFGGECAQCNEAFLKGVPSGKCEQHDTSTAIGKTSWPLAARDRAWDGQGAHNRIVEWAKTADGGIDEAKMKSVHFWVDDTNADKLAAYKMLFCDVVDGKIMACPRGIFACAGSRGVSTVKMADDDTAGVKAKIEAYYKRMADGFTDDSIMPPWMKETAKAATGADIFSQNLREQQTTFWRLESALCESAKEIANAAQAAPITGAAVDIPALVNQVVATYAQNVTASKRCSPPSRTSQMTPNQLAR